LTLFGALWLVFLARPITAAFERNPEPTGRMATILVAVAFSLLYLTLFWSAHRPMPPGASHVILAGLAGCSAGMCLLAGVKGLFTLVYLAALGGMVFAPVAAAVWGATLVAAATFLPLLVTEWEFGAAIPFAVAMATVASLTFIRLVQRNQHLLAAQDEIGRLAVADERLRFSRDLHDTLGHHLTVIAAKAELASKLATATPERSQHEILDVQRLARESLAELRTAVGGYRTTSLHGELERARQALATANIHAELPAADSPELDPAVLPAARQELFGWVVREGVTNTIRHSKANTCTVQITATSVEIVDDGQPSGERHESDPLGHGLTGLRERVRAAGGTMVVGHTSDGGFRLHVEVPA
jgi:two-component system, NarL family, sensor histidine kinase DesK